MASKLIVWWQASIKLEVIWGAIHVCAPACTPTVYPSITLQGKVAIGQGLSLLRGVTGHVGRYEEIEKTSVVRARQMVFSGRYEAQ